MSRYGHLPVPVLPDVEDIRRRLTEEVEVRVAERMQAERIRATAESLVQVTDGAKKIACIRILRTAFGLDLLHAKNAYDAATARLDAELSKEFR